MQNLSDTNNLRKSGIFVAVANCKGLIDVMSSLGIGLYLTDRTDERKLYSVVDPGSADASRQCKNAKVILGWLHDGAHVCLHAPFI